MEGVVVLLLSLLSCCLVASGNVVLIGKNVTMAFDDVEASFSEFLSLSPSFFFCSYLFWYLVAKKVKENERKRGTFISRAEKIETFH